MPRRIRWPRIPKASPPRRRRRGASSRWSICSSIPTLKPIAGGAPSCDLFTAIARDTAKTAAGLLAGWRDPWSNRLTSAGQPGNASFPTPDAATRALYGALTDALRMDADQRLGLPLGTAGTPQPHDAEAWRSGRSLANLKGSLTALRAYVAVVFAPALAPDAAARADASFDAALAAAGSVGAPIDVAVATPEGRARVVALQAAVRDVQAEMASDVGPALGIGALDGG